MKNNHKVGVEREGLREVVGVHSLNEKIKESIVLLSTVSSLLNSFSADWTKKQSEKTALVNEKTTLEGQIVSIKDQLEKERNNFDVWLKVQTEEAEKKTNKAQADFLEAQALRTQANKELEKIRETQKELNLKLAQAETSKRIFDEKVQKLKELSS